MTLIAAVAAKPVGFGHLLLHSLHSPQSNVLRLFGARISQLTTSTGFGPCQNSQRILRAVLKAKRGHGNAASKLRSSHHRNIHAAENGGVNGAPSNGKPDAIFILAGGQTPSGGVPVWVERRLESALIEYERWNRNVPLVCMGGGTPHRQPFLNETGHVIHEGTSLAQYLLSNGVRPEHIYKEWGSYDTVANAYFALVWHAIPARWSNLVVITSEFHMPRSRLLFEWVFGLEGAGGRNSNSSNYDSKDGIITKVSPSCDVGKNGYTLKFLSSSNAGIDPGIIQPRVEKEMSSLVNVKKLMASIHTLEDFHQWFHMEHKAYNVADQHNFGREMSKNPALASY